MRLAVARAPCAGHPVVRPEGSPGAWADTLGARARHAQAGVVDALVAAATAAWTARARGDGRWTFRLRARGAAAATGCSFAAARAVTWRAAQAAVTWAVGAPVVLWRPDGSAGTPAHGLHLEGTAARRAHSRAAWPWSVEWLWCLA